MLKVELLFFQREAVVLCEQEIVGRICLILEGQSLLKCSPLCGTGFLAVAIVSGIHDQLKPNEKNDDRCDETIKHRNRCIGEKAGGGQD